MFLDAFSSKDMPADSQVDSDVGKDGENSMGPYGGRSVTDVGPTKLK